MSPARARGWSVALLALSAVALGSATASALAACSSCCDETMAEAPAPCDAIAEVDCCDAAPVVQPATSSAPKPVPAVSSPARSALQPAATPQRDAVELRPRPGIPARRGVVLRL